MTAISLSQAQRLLLQHKIHVAPNAYAASPKPVQIQFSSGWSAAIEAAQLLGALPEDALLWWAEQPRGHLLLTGAASGYVDGAVIGEAEVEGVAQIPLEWLTGDVGVALTALLRPLDHLLGCGGAAEGVWLSQGGGVTPRWQRIGAQIARLFALGYGESEQSRRDHRVYLAEGLALALTDRHRLNCNDPKLERLLADSFLSPGFWRNFRAERAGPSGADTL